MARPKAAKRDHHVQIDLGTRSFERLQRLKEVTEAGSYSEVFSDALRLYEAIAQDVLEDGEIFVRRKDGTTVPYRIVLAP